MHAHKQIHFWWNRVYTACALIHPVIFTLEKDLFKTLYTSLKLFHLIRGFVNQVKHLPSSLDLDTAKKFSEVSQLLLSNSNSPIRICCKGSIHYFLLNLFFFIIVTDVLLYLSAEFSSISDCRLSSSQKTL